jgi:putative flippase GtrA
MKGFARIAALYAVFALIATAVNIGCQALVVWRYKGVFAVPLSVLVGTVTGLPVKYVLEKRHIFCFASKSLAQDSRIFMLYSFMGVFTTALFWGIEYAFHTAFSTDIMRYVGGAIGLTIGNIIKYHLDKHFVFVHRAVTAPSAT